METRVFRLVFVVLTLLSFGVSAGFGTGSAVGAGIGSSVVSGVMGVSSGGNEPVDPPTKIDGNCKICFYADTEKSGHAFYKLRAPDKKWYSYGFYTKFSSASDVSNLLRGDGFMLNDIRHKWDVKACYEINAQQCRSVFEVTQKWKNDQKYNVATTNCANFVNDVAEQIGLSNPKSLGFDTKRCFLTPNGFADELLKAGGTRNENQDKTKDFDDKGEEIGSLLILAKDTVSPTPKAKQTVSINQEKPNQPAKTGYEKCIDQNDACKKPSQDAYFALSEACGFARDFMMKTSKCNVYTNFPERKPSAPEDCKEFLTKNDACNAAEKSGEKTRKREEWEAKSKQCTQTIFQPCIEKLKAMPTPSIVTNAPRKAKEIKKTIKTPLSRECQKILSTQLKFGNKVPPDSKRFGLTKAQWKQKFPVCYKQDKVLKANSKPS